MGAPYPDNERQVLPAAPRCLQPKERDQDLPLKQVGSVVMEQTPVVDGAHPPGFQEQTPWYAVTLSGIDGAAYTFCVLKDTQNCKPLSFICM